MAWWWWWSWSGCFFVDVDFCFYTRLSPLIYRFFFCSGGLVAYFCRMEAACVAYARCARDGEGFEGASTPRPRLVIAFSVRDAAPSTARPAPLDTAGAAAAVAQQQKHGRQHMFGEEGPRAPSQGPRAPSPRRKDEMKMRVHRASATAVFCFFPPLSPLLSSPTSQPWRAAPAPPPSSCARLAAWLAA